MTKRLKARVVLGGIGYNTQEHEGLIVFTHADGMIGRTAPKFSFERKGGVCWYLSLQYDHVSMTHIQQAFALVEEAYGPNFYPKEE